MIGIAIISFVMSGILIVFSYFAFTPIVPKETSIKWFFVCLYIKSVCWSPFFACEYWDTIFENIYFDVKCQLNPIKPNKGERTKSNILLSENYSDKDSDDGKIPIEDDD